jgi:predicted GH43/DUF377 family glycosyl hydrolase
MDRNDCDCNFFFVRTAAKLHHPMPGKFSAFSHSYHSVHKKKEDKPCAAIGEECPSRNAAFFFPTSGAGLSIQKAVQSGAQSDQFILLLLGGNSVESLFPKLDAMIQGNASFAASFRSTFNAIAVNVEISENDPYHIDGGFRKDERIIILTSMGQLLGSQPVVELLDPLELHSTLDSSRLGDLQATAGVFSLSLGSCSYVTNLFSFHVHIVGIAAATSSTRLHVAHGQQGMAAINPSVYEEGGDLFVMFRLATWCYCKHGCRARDNSKSKERLMRDGPEYSLLYVCSLLRHNIADANTKLLSSCKVLDEGTRLTPPESLCEYSIAPKGAEDPRVIVVNRSRYVMFTGISCGAIEANAKLEDLLQLSDQAIPTETKRKLVWDKQLLAEKITVWLVGGRGRPQSLTVPMQQSVEKNWIPFVSMGSMFVSYLLSPDHHVLKIDVDSGALEEFGSFSNAVLQEKATIDGWAPSLRGGTTYVEVGDYLIAMCHARYPYADVTDQKKRSLGLTGYMHFWYAIPQSPPFHVVAASKPFKLPVTIAKEELQPSIAQSAFDIQFASGLVRDRDHLVVSYGQADCAAGLARYKINRVLAVLGIPMAE